MSSLTQENAERPVVDQLPRKAGDAREQLVQIENGADLPADFSQRFERARVLPFPLEEPRVFNRDGDVRRELAQQHLVGLGELAFGVAQQVDRADDASLPPHRDDQLGARPGHRFDVSRIGAHVVHEDVPGFGDGGADEAVTELYAQVPNGVVGIADGVRDRQLLALGIEQIHGEGIELRDPRDQDGQLGQQLVEIEDRRHFAAELEERDYELADVAGRDGRRGVWSEFSQGDSGNGTPNCRLQPTYNR